MRKVIVLITEILLIMAAITIADYWQSKFDIIPRSLISLPGADYTRADFWLIMKIFLGLHFCAFLIMQIKAGAWIFTDVRRTASEIFLLIGIYSISALVVFITTTVSFDPDLMAGIGLCSIGLFLLTHILLSLVSGVKILHVAGEIVKALFKQLFSLPGIIVLILALTPPVLAYAFTKSRDFANVITQIRINVSGLYTANHNYSLISITGDYRFKQPMLARMASNDLNTLYVLERSGRILSMPYPFDTSDQPKVIIDLQDKLGYVEVENGALGFTFHPEFGQLNSNNSGYLYLYYTDVRDDKQVNRISRFDLNSGSSLDIVLSETPILILNRETSGFHNGGSIEFGPDHFLYIALGEGIRLKDENSQAKTLRQGIIRIDVDMKGGDISHPVNANPVNGSAQNYFIPNDNPFVGRTDIREEYWAIGLRNPFRMSFDVKTGDLWAGDVGSTKWEEVNLIKKAGNYQFPYAEGFEFKASKKPTTSIGQEIEPVYTYRHTAYDRAVIGGIVYRNGSFSELAGYYVFADNYSSKVYLIPTNKKSVSEAKEIARANQYAQRGISSVSQLPNGDVLVTILGRASDVTGEVLKLSDRAQTETRDISTLNSSEPMKISIAEARDIFVTNCSRCHGRTGQADGPDSLQLGIDIPDFTSQDFQSSRADEALQHVIAKGGYAAGLSPLMPPWEGVLAQEEVNALVDYIRNLRQE